MASATDFVEPRCWDPLHLIGYTPAGTLCEKCGKSFKARRWRPHFVNNHPEYKFRKAREGFLAELYCNIRAARNDPNRIFYSCDKKRYRKKICTNCNIIFGRPSELNRHVKQSKGKCTHGDVREIDCYLLRCKRFYPVVGTLGVGEEGAVEEGAAEEDTDEDVITPPAENGVGPERTTELSNLHTPHPLLDFFGPVPLTYQNKRPAVDKVLYSMVGSHDRIDHYRKVFMVDIASDPPSYTTRAAQTLNYYKEGKRAISSNHAISKMCAAYDILDSEFPMMVAGMPGNLRTAAIQFRPDEVTDTGTESNAQYRTKYGFRARKETSTDHRKEFRLLLVYLWKRGCPLLPRYLSKLNNPQYLASNAHADCTVSRFLFELCMEEPSGADTLPTMIQFALSRCMWLDKDRVRLKTSGKCSKRIASILYLMRQAVLTGALSVRNTGDSAKTKHLIREAQGSSVINLLSPMVNVFKTQHKKEIPKTPSLTDDRGDIVFKNALFRHEIYSTLIPRVASTLLEIYSTIFVGDEWRCFMARDSFSAVGDWYNCEVEARSRGRTISLSSLELIEGYAVNSHTHQQLQSQIELIFHCLGGGAERYTTVLDLFPRQIRLDTATGNMYYILVHDKHASILTLDRDGVIHKVPGTLVPLVLLFRRVCQICVPESRDMFPSIPSRQHLMKHAVATHFHIDPSTCDALVVRHFSTTITNIVFAKKKEQGIITADDEAARLCNHTPDVHNDFYSTDPVNKTEQMYSKFHRFLGESTDTERRGMTFKRVSIETQLNALNLLCGSSTFLSDNQKCMADICCNDTERHNYFGLACGGGKTTISILLPVVAEFLMRRQTGSRFFVVPYIFLKDTLLHAFQERLRPLGDNITVDAFSGSEIPDDSAMPLPRVFNSSHKPPDIVILTVDAAAHLIANHAWVLRSWAGKNFLSAIYFDEIQTMMTEFGFRPVYQMMRDYAAIGKPMSILSGSFHRGLVLPVMRYLGMYKDGPIHDSHQDDVLPSEDTINIIQTDDPIGREFDFIVLPIHTIDLTGIYIEKRLQSESTSIHVICKDTTMAASLADKMKAIGVDFDIAHANLTREEQEGAATRWLNGDIRVLISTTIALVGNENKECREIIVVGLLYNLSSLIQAMGRLRKNQRGPKSRVVQVVLKSEDYSHQRYINESNMNMQQLQDAGIIGDSDIRRFKDLFHYESYIDFLTNTRKCLLSRLAEICGTHGLAECDRCTWCKRQMIPVDIEILDRDKQKKETINTNAPTHVATSAPNNRRTLVARSAPRLSATRKPASSTAQTTTPGPNNPTKLSLTRNPSNPYKRKSPPPPTHVQQMARNMTQFQNNRLTQKQMTREIEAKLSIRCHSCGVTSCPGDKCAPGCFYCGGKHFQKDCPFRKGDARDSLQRFLTNSGVCTICLLPVAEGTTHGVQGEDCLCPAKKRFRALIRYRLRKTNESFDRYLRRIHASADTYHEYMSREKLSK